MSDVERIAQEDELPHFDLACPDGCDEVIDSLRAALARRDAAIQAVRDVCDKADAANLAVTYSGARWPTTVYANRIRVAIAAELEKPNG